MRANAAIAVEAGRVEFEEVEIPEPGEEDVLIRLQHSWISNGTESSFIRGERIAGDTPRTESDPLPFPHAPGYQKTGIVEHVGGSVKGISVGDRVFTTVSQISGMFYSSGGHISPALSHQSQVWKLPDEVTSLEASGLVLTQVGYNVGIRPPVSPGDLVVVIGDGMVGHWAAQTLQCRGAKVLMLGKHDERLALLRKGDGDRSFNLSRLEGPLLKALELPGQIVAIADTVGSIPTVESLYPAIRREGHLISAGFYGNEGKIDIQKMRDRELTLQSPSGWTKKRMDDTLELLRRKQLRTEELITHRFPAEQANSAYRLILERTTPVLGVVLDW